MTAPRKPRRVKPDCWPFRRSDLAELKEIARAVSVAIEGTAESKLALSERPEGTPNLKTLAEHEHERGER